MIGAISAGVRAGARKMRRKRTKTEELRAKKNVAKARYKAESTDKEKLMSAGRRRAKAQGGADSRRNAGTPVKQSRSTLGKKSKLKEKLTRVKARLEKSKKRRKANKK